jgi:hypothetical protein
MMQPNRLRQNRISTVPITAVSSLLATANREKQLSATSIHTIARPVEVLGIVVIE